MWHNSPCLLLLIVNIKEHLNFNSFDDLWNEAHITLLTEKKTTQTSKTGAYKKRNV